MREQVATVSVDEDRIMTLLWPEGRPEEVRVSVEVFESMVEEINQFRRIKAALR